jgi:signal transduction protein with GAF and PtsI domain
MALREPCAHFAILAAFIYCCRRVRTLLFAQFCSVFVLRMASCILILSVLMRPNEKGHAARLIIVDGLVGLWRWSLYGVPKILLMS